MPSRYAAASRSPDGRTRRPPGPETAPARSRRLDSRSDHTAAHGRRENDSRRRHEWGRSSLPDPRQSPGTGGQSLRDCRWTRATVGDDIGDPCVRELRSSRRRHGPGRLSRGGDPLSVGTRCGNLFSLPFDDRHLARLLEALDPSSLRHRQPDIVAGSGSPVVRQSALQDRLRRRGRQGLVLQSDANENGGQEPSPPPGSERGSGSRRAAVGVPARPSHQHVPGPSAAHLDRPVPRRSLPRARSSRARSTRVLVVISYPSDLTQLDVTAEWERVATLCGRGSPTVASSSTDCRLGCP